MAYTKKISASEVNGCELDGSKDEEVLGSNPGTVLRTVQRHEVCSTPS